MKGLALESAEKPEEGEKKKGRALLLLKRQTTKTRAINPTRKKTYQR